MSITKALDSIDADAGKEKYHLIGYYSRYSSWTARIELLLEYFAIPYRASNFQIYDAEEKAIVKKYSATGKVPALIVSDFPQGTSITDSISIAEFLAEQNVDLALWPRDHVLRALARSAAAEIHSGFPALRGFDTNFLGKYTGNVPVSAQANKDIERVLELWRQSRDVTMERLSALGKSDQDEGWLFGSFSIADAFYWPVLWRFRTYNLPLSTASPEALAWIRKMWAHPVLRAQAARYVEQAKHAETYSAVYENIFKDKADVNYEAEAFGADWEFPN